MYTAEAVRLTRHGRTLVRDVTLALKPGTITVLVGPNGAGKSSLLKLMAGETTPSAGRVVLEGSDIRTLAPVALARRRAVLPQSADVAFSFRVDEVVRIGLIGSQPSATARIERLLERVDLGGFSERGYDTLSGGERQRVQLARALAQVEVMDPDKPRYLLLDEPTASLDLAHQLLVLREARAHAAAGGAVLAVLHDLNLAAMVADVIAVLVDGALLTCGPPAEVLTDATLKAAFRIEARINAVPDGPFLLPQTVVQGAA
ncbi:hemin import ATP-binding protein HmuV [Azorhizobium oxalatiphilum]|uniref:Hemin import ATP-binding protein HmuV n=1 Tax=Azorhizobium oxalatiphilum TaxID=980631 RepID=A0A917CAE2_9HYPH|nr:heme ABC transporter ATP-binding protein [Azorhizobium oxalatiphilum]GGF77754.1 hemin import ATP-binding protein HmuV [Azorhizobium oxalatiphilum]